ncbi:hypothetical protein [Salinicoccus halitifaciens]|uniref:Uncharacterized protein n=1 Tax=Salinicoccus halitifaciens TaxID=1073415 RepID=A0ABV2E8F4_9STAP|nr:hypothetical protein [Salinicoccus halitifaciens]MCD2137824.1 hypothetical protein [Salinicoccus halitifaciens]
MLMRKFLMTGGLSAVVVLGACGGEENIETDTETEPIEQEDRGEDIEEEEGEDDTSTE